MSVRLSERALNRALLARQGLLERIEAPIVEVVEAIGAMQGQAWPALAPGLASRMASFEPGDLYGALARGELRWGIGIRGTLHLVSDREHPDYAVVAAETTGRWQRALKETTRGMDELRAAVLEFAAQPRTSDEIGEFAERWVDQNPGAIDEREVAAQRKLRWRPIFRWSALTRVPRDGRWGPKAPTDHQAAPVPPGSPDAPTAADALGRVAARHLAAFGPAAAEDVAGWIGWRTPPVREQLDALDVTRFEDEHGRVLYDLPAAPRPDAGTAAPPRLLGAFDSALLAYAPKRRDRIVPDALSELVYDGRNLQIRPTILVDGVAAGTWALEVRRREATLTLRPAKRLARASAKALREEAERLAAMVQPDARAHRVVIE